MLGGAKVSPITPVHPLQGHNKPVSPFEELAAYRRRVAELYRGVREGGGNPETHKRFIAGRDRLFGEHSQSALSLEQKAQFQGLNYYDYSTSLRFTLKVDTAVEPEVLEVQPSEDGIVRTS